MPLKIVKKYPTIYFFLLYSIFFLPIILINTPYKDDYFRLATGDVSFWTSNGRPLTSLLMYIINLGTPIHDLFPFTLLLGFLIVAYSLTTFINKYFHDFSFIQKNIIAICFLSSPFLIENISYHFDALPMLIAFSLPLLASTISITHQKLSLFYKSLIVLASLCLYQPVIGNYLILLIFSICYGIIHNHSYKQIKVVVLNQTTYLILGCIFYKLIAYIYVGSDHYNQEHSEFIHLDNMTSAIQTLFDNTNNFLTFIYTGTQIFPILLLIGVGVITIISIFNHKEIYANKKLKRGLLLFLLLVTAFFSTFLPMIVLVNPVILSRVFLAFPVFLFLLYYLIIVDQKWLPLKYLLIISLVLCNFSFLYHYTTIVNIQNAYEENIEKRIFNDIHSTPIDLNSMKRLAILGNLDEPQEVKNFYNTYPLSKSLVQTKFDEDKDFGYYSLINKLNHPNLKYMIFGQEEIDYLHLMKPLVKNNDYTLYNLSDTLVIQFTKNL